MKSALAGALLLLVITLPVAAQQPADWKDPASHLSRFITVAQNVRLEVLDWGGTGRPLVLLAGGGDTAHVFDDFAPKLTADFRVYGITRRGFGRSSFAEVTSGAATWGDDVVAVLDALKLERPVLAGHSIAGQELSSIATRLPDRVSGLVYFDAGYPYAFDNGKIPTFEEIGKIGFPQPPAPGPRAVAAPTPAPSPASATPGDGRRARAGRAGPATLAFYAVLQHRMPPWSSRLTTMCGSSCQPAFATGRMGAYIGGARKSYGNKLSSQ